MTFRQPFWSRFLPTGLVVGVATLGPLGQRLPAPRTWGSLAGLLVFAVFLRDASAGAILVVSVVAASVADGVCGEAEIRLKEKDPGKVVLDEVVVMPLCFLGWKTLPALAPPWVALLAGFALFRLFDILKPFGIARLQHLPGGWGVVADDFAAALAACACLHSGYWLWARFG